MTFFLLIFLSLQVSAHPNICPAISYAGSPYCKNAGIATVTLSGTPGGMYTSTTGLSINSTTGDITLGTSTAGTYTVTYTSGSCVVTASVTIRANPSAPTISTPVNYCRNATATALTATGSNLMWGNTAPGSAGGTTILNAYTYIDNTYNNKKTNFTTTSANVTITNVDYYIPSYQSVSGAVLAIYNSTGTVIATSGTTTTQTAGATTVRIPNTFNYTIASAGNYSIGFYAGAGNIGYDSPDFPVVESSGTINITGVSNTGTRCFNNIQFPVAPSATAPIPSTTTAGTTNYTVNQNVGGCVSTNATITVNVNTVPSASISYGSSPFCGSLSSPQAVTQTGTTGGIYSSTTGLTINSVTGAITANTSTAGTYTVTYTMASAGGCSAQTAISSVTVTAAPTISVILTETCVGGSTGSITATAGGGIAPYTYSLNSGAYQSSGTFTGLAAGNYILSVTGNTGCISTSNITVTAFANSTDNQNAAGTDSWVGHVYDGITFNSYIGHYTEAENFNELFGGTLNCFNIVSNSLTRSIYTETFSVKYKMNSTKKGLYVADLGSDDGNRLTVDGIMVYNSWLYQSYTTRPAALMNLNGNSSLLYEYFESNGNNQVVFQNLTRVLANTLSANTVQGFCSGNTGSAISGDVYAVLPSGITLSGTGYQWSYSTSAQGIRTNITGANGASFTPSGTAAPFNTPGTYYIYRNAILSSANNISPNPYTATNESNAAIITINPAGQWNGSISTDWSDGGNWCAGVAPGAATDVVISTTASRMPTISNAISCHNLTIDAGATLITSSAGTLNIAGTLVNNGTMTNGGTTNFNGTTGQQTFSGTNTFNNITLSNTSGILFPAAITVNNNLLISTGTLNANNFGISIKGNWTNNVSTTAFIAGTGIVTFNGTTAQAIGGSFATGFNNLTISNAGNTVILNTNINIGGDLSIAIGTFDMAGFTANRASAGGMLTVANNATLKIGGTNTYPSNYTNNILVVASTVEYSGTNQIVANRLYGNLTLSSAAGAAVKTLPATALIIVGNLSSTLGAGISVSFIAASNVTVNGNVSIGTSTTFNGGSYIHSIGGNWVNNGIFNGNSSTIIFTGSGSVINGPGTQNFNNLTVAASSVGFSNSSISLTGNLATISSGSFSQATGGTFLMTGTGTTISGSGISIDNLAISGSVTTAISLNLTGNFSVNGSFTASAGTITMSGTSKTMSGAGTRSFSALYITGSVTTDANFSISSGITVSGSLSASAGTATFTGITSLSGTANLFNTTINGTSLQLATNSTLGIANLLTITAGILNTTSSAPNTVNFNGTGAQDINAIAYGNLVLSNGNIKTATGAITTAYDMRIGTGTTFNPSSYTHSIYGSWTNAGTFIPGTSTVQFLGDANAYITGVTSFNILTCNSDPTTALSLQNNISAAIVNMINGKISTGTNTITITGTRTGNGHIYGNIQRTHAFTTGVAYAFEGPDNTISFSAVSSVSSITVSVAEESVTDFPFGSSANREYNITVPTGTYTATLRLHYEDDELNGNDESTIGSWNYSGSVWIPVGKTANDAVSNYIELSGLTNISNRWTLSDDADVVQWNGSVSTDWNTAANWTVIQGSGSRPPTSLDIVELGTASFTYQPIISNTASVNGIHFGSLKAVTLTITSGGSLTSSGNIDGDWDANARHTINVNNQTLTVNGDMNLSDGTSNQSIDLNIGSGMVNILGSLIEAGDANINFSNAGTLNIHMDFNHAGGILNAGNGTIVYNGDENQVIAHINYNNLTINKAAGIATIDSVVNIAGNLLISSGELENYSNTTISGNVTIASGATLQNNNVLHVGGNWSKIGNYIGEGINVIFDGAGTQTISTSTFNNLAFNKPVGSLAVLTGDVTLKGNLVGTSGTLDIGSFFFNRNVVGGSATMSDSATLIIAADNAPNKFSSYYMAPNSTVIFNGTGTQHLLLPGMAYGNLTFRNTGSKILYSPITVNGNLTIESGASFDAGSNTITLNGNWINSGTFVPSTSTLSLNGTSKTISGPTTFYKVSVYGYYTILSNVTFDHLLTINPTGQFYAGSNILVIMNGDLMNKGVLYTLGTTTYTGNVLQTLSLINAVQTVALTVNFNGTVSPVLNSTSAPQFGYLNINNTGGINPSVGWTILYSLTVGNGASFNCGVSTHNIYGSLTNLGAITSSGILNFLPASAATVNLGTNFISTGRVIFGGAGAMTMAGTPASLHNVVIANTNTAGITPLSNWNMTNNFTINSGSIFNAGSYTYLVGGKISNSGIMNSGTSTFILDSAGIQDIYSLSPFNNLTTNKAAGFTTLSSDVAVNGVLNFISGKIQTGFNKLTQPSTGTVTGAAQNTGWVNGNMAKYIGTGIISKQFEIGDATNYTPVTTDFTTAITTGGLLTASTTAGDNPNIGSSGFNVAKTVNRYWTLKNSTIEPVEYNATFHFIGPVGSGDIDAGVDTAKLKIKRFNSNWSFTTDGSKTATSTQGTGINAFGDFQVATLNCNDPLINTITVTPISCSGNANGAIAINTTGGDEPFTYLWSDGEVTQNINNLIAGDYMVTITATGGCTITSDTLTITEPALVTAPVSGGNKNVCFNGDEEQTIIATATGGTIRWYNAPTGGNIVASPVQPGPGTVTYYAEASNGGCTSATRTAVTLTINNAPEAPVSDGDQTVCSDWDTDQTLVANVTSSYDLVWYDAATGGNVVSPVQIGIGSKTYYAEASNGTCYSPTRTPITLTINPILATPDSISGPINVCEMIGNSTPTTYSINPVAGATFYTWSIPVGTTLVSGQGTTSIRVIFNSSFALTHSRFTVTAESLHACTSTARSLEVLKIVPGIPVAINGPATVCLPQGQSTIITYFIDPVENATSYSWLASGGIIVLTGQGTTSIQVSYPDSFAYGHITVAANSNCGNRPARSLSISRLITPMPAAITGPTNACPYIGTATLVTYSIHPVVNITSYTWTVPTNVILVSGQGTTAITVTFNSGYTTAIIKVRSIGSCTSSSDRSISVVAPLGSIPGIISGPVNACSFIGTDTKATYTIRKLINAASYLWSVPPGATINSHPGGTGQNDTIITVAFDNNFISGTKISVQALNCLAGAARTLVVLRTLPSKPGLLAGPVNVCPFMVSVNNPSGIAVIYSIHKMDAALSYLWTVPGGATNTIHPAGTGINDTIIQVIYGSDFLSGTIMVAAVNSCGAGMARSLAISRQVASTPGGITILKTADCPNRRYTYSLATMPANAVSVLWVAPAGGIILSGQGTTSITVSFGTGAINSNVTATSYNNCGNSSTRATSIKLPACTGTIAGKFPEKTITVFDPPAEMQQVSISPNPAISDVRLKVLSGGADPITIRILNIEGYEIKNFVAKPNETIRFGNELKSGLYLIEVNQGKNKTVQKLVKL